MTTIFSLQKSILPSILNCIRITHGIVLYYSYQLLDITFVIFPLINKDVTYKIIFKSFCVSFVFAYQKTNSDSSLKHFSRNANCVCYSKTQTILFVSTSLRNKRFHLFSEQRKTEEWDFRIWPCKK